MLAASSVVQCSEVAMELSCTLALSPGRSVLVRSASSCVFEKALPEGLVQLRAIDEGLLSDVEITQQVLRQT